MTYPQGEWIEGAVPAGVGGLLLAQTTSGQFTAITRINPTEKVVRGDIDRWMLIPEPELPVRVGEEVWVDVPDGWVNVVVTAIWRGEAWIHDVPGGTELPPEGDVVSVDRLRRDP